MSLKQKYNIGDIRLHTILLFNTAGVTEAVALGGQQVLNDLYNGMASAADAEKVAVWTLQQMATKGGGTFQEFTDTASIALGALDYGSLASRFVSKTLMARNEFAFPTLTGPVPDSDGDGLPDSQDNPQTVGTSRFNTDTDGDGFSDAFEVAHKDEGFDPLVPDSRGCKSVAGKFTAKYDCSDTDKDLVLLPEEIYLGTDPTLIDSDADGIPDGTEVALGLNPAKANDLLADLDTDGVPDVLEALFHTNPLIDDRAVHATTQYRYQVTARADEANNRNCYDFLISNVKLVTTDRATGQVGFNYITVTFGEAPETGVQRDYGNWRQACVMAQFAPPSVRVPQGPEVDLQDSDFVLFRNLPRQTGSIMPPDAQVSTLCKGARFPPPEAFRRATLSARAQTCERPVNAR